MTELIFDKDAYLTVLQDKVLNAQKYVWFATSDLKDLYVEKARGIVPFLEILSDLINRKVSIRIIHAKEPGKKFRTDFDKYSELIYGMEMFLCPRSHLKTVIVDGKFAYIGSANLTGAGMGAKNENTRNFEAGFITENDKFIKQIIQKFDLIWMGAYCNKCKRKKYCFEYKDL